MLHTESTEDHDGAGIVTFQLIGVKNIRPNDALEKFGTDLFVKENDKKEAGKERGGKK